MKNRGDTRVPDYARINLAGEYNRGRKEGGKLSLDEYVMLVTEVNKAAMILDMTLEDDDIYVMRGEDIDEALDRITIL